LFLFAKQTNQNQIQEVNGTVILTPLVFSGYTYKNVYRDIYTREKQGQLFTLVRLSALVFHPYLEPNPISGASRMVCFGRFV